MKKWRTPPKFTVIQPTWRGIFVTCNRGRETQCAREIREWFEQVCDDNWPDDETEEPVDLESDLEAEIKNEVNNLKTTKHKKIVVHEKLGVECVLFVQTRFPVCPVKLCEKVCFECYNRTRTAKYIQKLSPVQKFVKCNEELSDIDQLKPVLLNLTLNSKYAIRPTLRLTPVTRDIVIPKIAKLIGPNHKVDLQNYDELVLVEGFKTVVGCAVFNMNAEEVNKYCKFNLSQITATNAKFNGNT